MLLYVGPLSARQSTLFTRTCAITSNTSRNLQEEWMWGYRAIHLTLKKWWCILTRTRHLPQGCNFTIAKAVFTDIYSGGNENTVSYIKLENTFRSKLVSQKQITHIFIELSSSANYYNCIPYDLTLSGKHKHMRSDFRDSQKSAVNYFIISNVDFGFFCHAVHRFLSQSFIYTGPSLQLNFYWRF